MRGVMALPYRTMRPLSRRTFLTALAASLAAPSAFARAHNNAGVVDPPAAPPSVGLTLDDGTRTNLAKFLGGHVSAVQLMFTSCGATCPIQGAVFAEAARSMGDSLKHAQWLSVSIDPARDDPKTLHSWMARFGAHARWRAARPDPKQLDPLYEFLKARNPEPDRHTAQVYFFNRRGQLAMRSVDFPSSKEIARVLTDLATRA